MTKKATPKGGKNVVEELEVRLTPDEKESKIQGADKLLGEMDTLKVDRKEINVQLRDKAAQQKLLVNQAASGMELRKTQCKAVKNFDENVVEYWKDDKLLKTRDMTDDDRQGTMALKDKDGTVKKANVVHIKKNSKKSSDQHATT